MDHHSLGQRACGCERRGVGSLMVWRDLSRWVNVGSVNAGLPNHRRAGTEADQRGRGGMNHVKAGNGRSGCCWSRFDANRFAPVGSGGASRGELEQVLNHTREGTVPDQRGRCGMNRGLAGSVTSRCDRFCCVRAWRGVIDYGNHARAGTGLDQRQRRGMDSVASWSGTACLDESSYGMADPVLFSLQTTIVVGTAAASTPRGGIESRLTEIAEFTFKGATDGTNAR